jgi:hypothetical protein
VQLSLQRSTLNLDLYQINLVIPGNPKPPEILNQKKVARVKSGGLFAFCHEGHKEKHKGQVFFFCAEGA